MKTTELAFLGNPVSPHSEKRFDGIVEKMRSHPQARLIGFCGDQLVIKSASGKGDAYLTQSLFAILKPDWDNAIYLGSDHDKPVFAAPLLIDPQKLRPPFVLTGLRDVWSQALIPLPQTGVLAQATSSLSWHKNNSYCARCGHKSDMFGGGAKRVCKNCGAEHFPRLDPVAIMLIHLGDRCLLARTPNFPAKRYTCLAGFVEQGETLEAAVRRETMEEMGIPVGHVRYLASQPWPFPHQLMFGCFGDARHDKITIDKEEMEDGRWFDRAEVLSMIDGTHPNGLTVPPPGAIANFLIRSWVEG